MKGTRHKYRFGFTLLLLSPMGLAFSACGTEGQPTGAGVSSTSSTSSSGSGGALQCESIHVTGVLPLCDQCVYQNCCSELLACEETSPFCPWACAIWSPGNPGCEAFHDVIAALLSCSAANCRCVCTGYYAFACDGGVACSGDSSQCDGGADGDTGTGGGGGGSASSGSG